MAIPKINSAHGADTRNIINRSIEVLNRLGIDVQTLVAEGQLTEEQYAELIKEVNGLIAKGEVKLNDLSPEILEAINNGDGTSFEILSIPRDRSVSPDKTTFIDVSSNLANTENMIKGYTLNLDTGLPEPTISSRYLSQFFKIEPGTKYISSGINIWGEYNSNKELVHSNRGSSVITTNEETEFLRFSTDYVDTVQINKSETLLSYEPFYYPKLSSEIKTDFSGFLTEENESWEV